jgi:hypothetical protein
VGAQSFVFPIPEKISIPELGETLPVFTGAFRATGKMLVRSGINFGNCELKGKLNFQECSNQICKIPASAAFEIPFTIDSVASAVPKN